MLAVILAFQMGIDETCANCFNGEAYLLLIWFLLCNQWYHYECHPAQLFDFNLRKSDLFDR